MSRSKPVSSANRRLTCSVPNRATVCLLLLTVGLGGLLLAGYSVHSVSASSDALWYDQAWSYRKSVTIDPTKVQGNPAGFPVLIKLASDSDLASKAQSSGNDILFTKSDGTTKIPHEIEKYVGATGELEAWVKTDLSSTSNTVLYMYYGNPSTSNQQQPTLVWDSNYQAVWHLKQDPSGTAPQMKDSTSNARDGTAGCRTTGTPACPTGTSGTNLLASQQVTAKVDGGLSLDQADNGVALGYGEYNAVSQV